MLRKPLLPAAVLFGALTLTACASGEGETHTDAATEQAEEADANGEEEQTNVVVNEAGGYGAVITAEGAMDADELIAAMGDAEEMPAKVRGTVTAACQMSGCWMNLPYGEGEEMRVSFIDYSFFVPKDLAGTEVVVEGVARKTEVSVETLRHFAEDEGKSAEEVAAITEPAWEVEFVATGVLPVKG
jgi:hypothetical protein